MDLNLLALTWGGWPNGRLACKFDLNQSEVIASQGKYTQGLGKLESQVDPSIKLETAIIIVCSRSVNHCEYPTNAAKYAATCYLELSIRGQQNNNHEAISLRSQKVI